MVEPPDEHITFTVTDDHWLDLDSDQPTRVIRAWQTIDEQPG